MFHETEEEEEAQHEKLEIRGEQSFCFNEVRMCKRSAGRAQQMRSLHAGGAEGLQQMRNLRAGGATDV